VRELKIQVETEWSITLQEWNVTVWIQVGPANARYLLANFQTTSADPMVEVTSRIARVFE
jgi:hypothetical protein